eukprot:2337174-Pleurochrysis_carterae.AAC.1
MGLCAVRDASCSRMGHSSSTSSLSSSVDCVNDDATLGAVVVDEQVRIDSGRRSADEARAPSRSFGGAATGVTVCALTG